MSVERFKVILDTYLDTVPDEPRAEAQCPRGLNQIYLENSDSVLWMTKLADKNIDIKESIENLKEHENRQDLHTNVHNVVLETPENSNNDYM